MKKVALLIDSLAHSGGTERVCVNLANSLAKCALCEVTIYSIHGNETFFEVSKDVKVVYLSEKEGVGAYLRKIFSTFRDASHDGIDSLICVSMGKLSLVSALMYRLVFSKKFCFYASEHVGFSSFGFFKKHVKRLGYFASTKVVVLTESDRALLIEMGHDNVEKIPNYIPDGFLLKGKRENSEQRKNLFLSVGRLTYQKNFEKLIDLWCRAGQKDKAFFKNNRLIIVGDGEERGKLAEKIDTSASGSIVMVSSSKKLANFYEEATAFLMTSRYEGLPMVLIESQTYGVPAVSFDCPTGPSEIIVDEENGFLIKEGDDDAFVRRILELSMDKELQYRQSESAAILSNRFSESQVLKKWYSLLGVGIND